MATVTPETSSTSDKRLVIQLLNHPDANIVLRSQDSHDIQVPKIYFVNSSPVFSGLIQKTLDAPSNANAEESLPVLQLPESGEILECLLTFVFPVTPRVPSTLEGIMELLSVAQKYQMGAAPSLIRAIVAQQNLLPTRLDPALHLYALAQKYELRPEALQAAQSILKHPMTIESLYDKLDIMPGASLYQLWKYHERVRAILASDLTEFRASKACGMMTGLRCTELSSSRIPSWLDRYIESIGKAPDLFDTAELNIALARHIKDKAEKSICKCSSMPRQTIREFWEALASVVNSGFLKAESALCLVQEQEDSQVQIYSTKSQPEIFHVSDANLILRSSDLVNFRVHKLILVIVSPFFRDMLSLPRPLDSETVDGLPVIQLSEDSELLNYLVSMLYPLHPVVKPDSYDKVLYLLAACQKYEMDSVLSFIRSKVTCGEFPAPNRTEAFATYAIASAKGLIPEMEKAASQTLRHPMTFESLGESLRLFEGRTLRDLTNYRRRCLDNIVKFLDPYLEAGPGPSSIWVGCPQVMPDCLDSPIPALPAWLNTFLSRKQENLKLHKFTQPLVILENPVPWYFKALRTHADCGFCTKVHATNGLAFCITFKEGLEQALDKESVRSPDVAVL